MSSSVDLPSIQTKFPLYSSSQQHQQQSTPVTALSNSFSALSSSSPRQYKSSNNNSYSPCSSPLLPNTTTPTFNNMASTSAAFQNNTSSSNSINRGSFSVPSLTSRLSNSSLHSQYSASSDRSLSCSPGPSTPSDMMSRSPSFSYERLQNSNNKPASLQLHKQQTLPASFSPLLQQQRYSSNGIHPFQQSYPSPSPSHTTTTSNNNNNNNNNNNSQFHHSYHQGSSIPHPATAPRQQQSPSMSAASSIHMQPQQQYHGQTGAARDGFYPSSPSPSSPTFMSSRDQEYHHQQHHHHHRRSEPYYHSTASTTAGGHRASPVSTPFGNTSATTPSSASCGSGDYFSRPPTSPSYHPLATPTTPSTMVTVENGHSYQGYGRGGPMTPTLPSISTLVAGVAAAAASAPSSSSPLTPMTPIPVTARPHHLLHHHHYATSYQGPSSPAISASSGSGRQGMMRMMDDEFSPNMSTMSRSPSISSDRSSASASASVFSPESSPYLGHLHRLQSHSRRPDTPESSPSTPLVGSAPSPTATSVPTPTSAVSSSSQLLLCPVCSRAFKPSKNQNCNLRRHLKNVHNMSPTMHPRKCKWDSLPDGRVKDDKDRKERTRKSKRLWARKFRLRRKVEEAAVVLSMLSQAI